MHIDLKNIRRKINLFYKAKLRTRLPGKVALDIMFIPLLNLLARFAAPIIKLKIKI